MTQQPVDIIRVYDDEGRHGGDYRVLIDRLWPRGKTSDALDFDEWNKVVAPSAELRRWYGHDVARFEAFAERYRTDLTTKAVFDTLRELNRRRFMNRLILLTATRDLAHSSALVLREMIMELPSS